MSRLVLTRIPRAILSTSVRIPALKPINVRYLSATQSLLNEVDVMQRLTCALSLSSFLGLLSYEPFSQVLLYVKCLH